MKRTLLFALLLACTTSTLAQSGVNTNGNSSSATDDPVEFRMKVFSDFAGLDDDQPNGLVQTEFFWSFPLVFVD